MCRWITLLSSRPVSLSDVVLSPSNAMIQMSVDSSYHPGFGETNNHRMNGDGFGVGWYHGNHFIIKKPVPVPGAALPPGGPAVEEIEDYDPTQPPRNAAVFKDVLPAWNNINLKEICQATYSDCIMAHVRAASKGSGVSQQNCHPFKAGRLLFCHNGRIDQFPAFRRQYHALLSDEAYMGIRGTTDSEFIFALLLTILARDGCDKVSPITQIKPFGHDRLVRALKEALRLIEKVQADAGFTEGYNTCNFSLTDGETIVVTRYCDKSPDIPAPSLYFAFGDADELHSELIREEIPPVLPPQHQPSCDEAPNDAEGEEAATSSNSDSDDSNGDNADKIPQPRMLKMKLSARGRIFADVDLRKACMVVCSIPLTHTHKWHRIPRNSVLYFTKGSYPELASLKNAKAPATAVPLLEQQ